MTMTSSSTFAETYRWQDEDSIMQIGEKPPAGKEYEGGTISSYQSATFQHNPLSAQGVGGIVMYSTRWCGYCEKARRHFKRNQIPFREYDVETSRKGRRDFKALGGRGVPVILVGKQRMNGFNSRSFDQMYQQ